MADDEDSMPEDFSDSGDDWIPPKDQKGGESSDDDDSDFEQVPLQMRKDKKTQPKQRTGGAAINKQNAAINKRRKSSGQSLRTKLYNKYRPPPKALTSPTSSPRASTSAAGAASKNADAPNDSNDDDDSSCSNGSLNNYLVHADKIDCRSDLYNLSQMRETSAVDAPTPVFNCFAGMTRFSDSDSEDNIGAQPYNFDKILQNVQDLESAKTAISERVKADKNHKAETVMDIGMLLALGEKKPEQRGKSRNAKKKSNYAEKNVNDDEQDEDGSEDGDEKKQQVSTKLMKTKSTRQKREQIRALPKDGAGANSDDSDWEEVPEYNPPNEESQPHAADIEICLELPSHRQRQHSKLAKTKRELINAVNRQMNRQIKERQLLLHKTSLLCLFARFYYYNRILNDRQLMQASLKLLPSKNSYPANEGTAVSYFRSLVTWYKTAVKLQSPQLYMPAATAKECLVRGRIKNLLVYQIRQKAVTCREHFVFIIVILLRAMGLECRLVVNMQPLPMKPNPADLFVIKMKDNNDTNKDNAAAMATTTLSPQSKTLQNTEQSSKTSTKKNVSNSNSKAMQAAQSSNAAVTETVSSTAAVASERPRKSAAVKEATTSPSKTRRITRKSAATAASKEASLNNISLQACDELRGFENTDLNVADVQRTLTQLSTAAQSKTTTARQVRAAPKLRTSGTAAKPKASTSTKADKPVLQLISNLPVKVDLSTLNLRKRKLSSHKKTNLPQLDGADDDDDSDSRVAVKKARTAAKNTKKRTSTSTTAVADGPSCSRAAKTNKSNAKSVTAKKNAKATSDDDFQPTPIKVQQLRKDRRVLSTDDDNEADAASKQKERNANAADIWIEVWCDVESKWICIDLVKGEVDCPAAIQKAASKSFSYIYAFSNDLKLKDVTARYNSNWTRLHKDRVDQVWLDNALANYYGEPTLRDTHENDELRLLHEEQPMPTAISQFKNHPLYALQRHLLKFQGIYPPDARTLGFVRGEPIYSRDCVHTLRSREKWLREARVVKPGEEPYKIVKAHPKWDRFTQTIITDLPLEIFGFWQTQPYEPPTAENGVVPRNAYGNVELFRDCMLPKKTVHLVLNGLERICKNLKVDCAKAIIGFEARQGYPIPTYHGYVICEEFAEMVKQAWREDQLEQARKEQKKKEDRVYGNWKKLIKGVQIRERLKQKYNY